MDVDGLPIVGAAVDLSKVAPIHQKRTLAFVNHFLTHTVNFLNKFSSVCETKLEDINVRIQRIETSLTILEAKLSSIPGLDDVTLPTDTTSQVDASFGSEIPNTTPTHDDSNSSQTIHSNTTTEKDETVNVENNYTRESSQTQPTVSQDARYAKYLKLIQMGVPKMALRPKMLADGLDPDLLDTPNAPAPPDNFVRRNLTESESETTSEFSD